MRIVTENFDEQELINGCLNGSRSAQKRLYDLYSEYMYAVCLRYTKNPEDAQDVLQDGFIRVFKNLHLFRGDGSFEGWIRRVIVNTILTRFKRQKKLLFTEDIEVAMDSVLSNDLIENIETEHLRTLIAELPPGYRLVFNMHEIEGFNHKEIAEELEISVGTSKSQLARARKMLQEKLELYGSYNHNVNYKRS